MTAPLRLVMLALRKLAARVSVEAVGSQPKERANADRVLLKPPG